MHKPDDGVKQGGNSSELWTDGLLCAFEYVPGEKQKHKVGGRFGDKSGPVRGKFDAKFTLKKPPLQGGTAFIPKSEEADEVEPVGAGAHPGVGVVEDFSTDGSVGSAPEGQTQLLKETRKHKEPHWVPVGWARLSELVQLVQVDAEWISQPVEDIGEDDDTLSVASLAAPYWQAPAGPTWWAHVLASHPHVSMWLANANWLHPAVSTALRDESRLISDRMKYLYYEVPVRVAGGLLFELLGQSVGDSEEEIVPVVLRSWQAEHYLITSMHLKGEVSSLNVLGISEVQDLVGAGGVEAPKSAHQIIALLASRLARWDNRLFRKHYFGAADEVELKFVHREEEEDLPVLSLIINQEIRRLSSSVIRLKWFLHAREEIVYELVEHLRGRNTQKILQEVRENTREMIEEQEAVRSRLFTIHDVMQNTLRSSLQDKRVRIQHNLTVVGGVGLLLSILTGLFGVNLDGIPGNKNTPFAFGVFGGCLFLVGSTLITLGMLCLGYKKPAPERVIIRTMQLQDLVKTFQHAAETHAKLQINPVATGSRPAHLFHAGLAN